MYNTIMILLVTFICSTVVLSDDDQWSRPAKADSHSKIMYTIST